MVEPRRQCLALAAIDLQKKAVGGVLYVTVVSASKLSRSNWRSNPSTKQISSSIDTCVDDRSNKELQTFIEIELEELTRKTDTKAGSNPMWGSTFNRILHGNAGVIKFNLYEYTPGSVKYDYLTSCEVKVYFVLNLLFILLQIEAAKVDDNENSKVIACIESLIETNFSTSELISRPLILLEFGVELYFLDILQGSHATLANGSIELVLIEARDLVAANLRGTSDPCVRVHYGTMKRHTKVLLAKGLVLVSYSLTFLFLQVMYKTMNPKWHQSFEFPDDGSPLVLHVKDHNTLLPRSSIGDYVVEYQMLSPNQMAEKWIPLQGVKRGEIHVQIIRKLPELENISSIDSELSPTKLHRQISKQMKQMMIKIQSLIDDNDLEGVSKSLSELETLHDTREEYMVQLELEQTTLIGKVKELGIQIFNSSPSLRRATLP